MRDYKKYLPEFLGVLLAALILNLWIITSLFIDKANLSISFDYLLKFITTATASMFGAFFAFKLNNIKAKSELTISEAEKINKTLLYIFMQLQIVGQVKFDLRSKYIFGLAFSHKLDDFYNPDIKIDIGQLATLLIHDPNIVSDVIKSQDKYLEMIHLINKRNTFFKSKIEPFLPITENGFGVDLDKVKDVFPDIIISEATSDIDIIKSRTDWAEKSLISAFEELNNLAVETYPNYKFIKMNT